MLDRLFSPLTINGKTLKNRCVVTPMLMNFCEEDGTCTERFAAYHEAKAKGGFAMIVTENVAVTSVAKGYQWIPGLWKDEHIPGFRDLTDRVHQYDTVIIAQLNHPGRQASEKYAKAQSWAPSAIPDPYHNEEMPHEMTIAEIHKTVEDFGDAALRAKKAGFDGIELHGAHGYMIPEFMSMYTNKRTDEYGGDLTNRMRFALEIIENVRQKCGPDFILGYRLSADERVTGGLTIEDTKAIVPYLDQAGVDYFSISIAVNATDDQMIPSMYYRHGYQADYAKEVKNVTCKPVITVGRINDTRIAESILRSHKADLIGFARQSLTDPETPNKAREGRFEDIRKCVGCLHGCVGHIDTGLAGSCELNPLVGHESDPEYQTVPAEHPKKVMVVGAGPAGMQAAIAAAECGHQVEVYDSDRWAGGQYPDCLHPARKGRDHGLPPLAGAGAGEAACSRLPEYHRHQGTGAGEEAGRSGRGHRRDAHRSEENPRRAEPQCGPGTGRAEGCRQHRQTLRCGGRRPGGRGGGQPSGLPAEGSHRGGDAGRHCPG